MQDEGVLTFGKAIYVSSYTSKAINYGEEILLYCDIVLGNVKVQKDSSNYTQEIARSKGFHSVFYCGNNIGKDVDMIKGHQADEYALYYED